MATAVKRKSAYTSYGNVAYDPAYMPGQEAEGRAEPLVRPRERVVGRTQVRVRPAGYVAPAAVVGFLLVGIMAVLLIMTHVQITNASNQIVRLKKEASTLSEEHAKLMTEYELAFDLKTVEETVTASGAMVQPQAGQLISLDLSEPDSAVLYNPNKGSDAVKGVWDGVADTFRNIVSFFR